MYKITKLGDSFNVYYKGEGDYHLISQELNSLVEAEAIAANHKRASVEKTEEFVKAFD